MTDAATNTNFMKHLHAFRGFAIVMIVAAHSWSYLLFSWLLKKLFRSKSRMIIGV